MPISDFTGENIETTYQRVVQTDGILFADGTGSLLTLSIGSLWELDDSGGEINYSTNEYIYWAIARHPFVSSKGVPTTAGTGNIVDSG